jgi:hypothetical protein
MWLVESLLTKDVVYLRLTFDSVLSAKCNHFAAFGFESFARD